MRNNRKRRPTHPGEILREDVLPSAGLTQDKLARLLGVSRRTVSEIVHERRPVTTDMTHRLARAFGTSPEMWLGLQHRLGLILILKILFVGSGTRKDLGVFSLRRRSEVSRLFLQSNSSAQTEKRQIRQLHGLACSVREFSCPFPLDFV